MAIEFVPDGAILDTHHAYIGILLIALSLWAISDDVRSEPLIGIVSVAGSMFSFLFIWPYYPLAGFVLSLGFIATALLSIVVEYRLWRHYPRKYLAMYLVGVLILSDDIVSHGLGVSTPLDYVWVHYIYPLL